MSTVAPEPMPEPLSEAGIDNVHASLKAAREAAEASLAAEVRRRRRAERTARNFGIGLALLLALVVIFAVRVSLVVADTHKVVSQAKAISASTNSIVKTLDEVTGPSAVAASKDQTAAIIQTVVNQTTCGTRQALQDAFDAQARQGLLVPIHIACPVPAGLPSTTTTTTGGSP